MAVENILVELADNSERSHKKCQKRFLFSQSPFRPKKNISDNEAFKFLNLDFRLLKTARLIF